MWRSLNARAPSVALGMRRRDRESVADNQTEERSATGHIDSDVSPQQRSGDVCSTAVAGLEAEVVVQSTSVRTSEGGAHVLLTAVVVGDAAWHQ